MHLRGAPCCSSSWHKSSGCTRAHQPDRPRHHEASTRCLAEHGDEDGHGAQEATPGAVLKGCPGPRVALQLWKLVLRGSCS